MAQQLIRYDAARQALQAARDIDEVKTIKDAAEAARAYAQQAGDKQMQNLAVEIKFRATRRLGQLLAEMRKAGELAERSDNQHTVPGCADGSTTSKKTLKELGIHRHLAADAEWLAGAADEEFDVALNTLKSQDSRLTGKALTDAVLAARRELKKQAGSPPPRSRRRKTRDYDYARYIKNSWALRLKNRTGKGQHIERALVDCRTLKREEATDILVEMFRALAAASLDVAQSTYRNVGEVIIAAEIRKATSGKMIQRRFPWDPLYPYVENAIAFKRNKKPAAPVKNSVSTAATADRTAVRQNP